MKISDIHLTNFRNIKAKKFTFSPKTTVIIGPNASGKTNIMESIFLLSSGKSFRVKIEEEMINHNVQLSRIKGRIGDTKLEVVLTRGELLIGDKSDGKLEKVAR